MGETWKDVKGFELYYQVSNLGNVRSKDRIIKRSTSKMFKRGRVLKPQPNSNGYLRVNLKANGNSKMFFVHRLVAEAFCNKVSGNNIVNHLDFNCTNNNADNLEWTTLKGNLQYSLQRGRFNRTEEWLYNQAKSLEKYCKPVIGVNITTGDEVYFKSINEAGRSGFRKGDVCRCCKGSRNTHANYKWEYYNKETMTPNELLELKENWR